MEESQKNTTQRSYRLRNATVKHIEDLAHETNRQKTEVIEQAIAREYRIHSASKIWGFGSGANITLMLADFPEHNPPYVNPNFEGSVVAIGTIAPIIALANEDKRLIVHMHRFPIEFNENLLLLGGPKRNNVTNFFLNETALAQESTFDEWTLKLGEKEYEAETVEEIVEEKEEKEKHVLQDYGLLLKAPNPLKPECTVMIVAGCRAFGTGGAAALVASDGETQKLVGMLGEGNCKYFKAVVSVSVRNDRIARFEVNYAKALDYDRAMD